MNDLEKPPVLEAPAREAPAREPAPPDHGPDGRPPVRREAGGGARRWALGLAVIAVLVAALGFGVWRHYRQYREAQTTAAQHRDSVPTVRVEPVRASPAKMLVSLPATTNAYEAASIFARASGYIEKRYVDIGSRVTAGQILAEITAPELDHQIAQAEASVAQLQGTLRQTEANRSLAQITNERNLPLVAKNYVSKLQGDTDRLNAAAQEHAAAAARANMEAQSAAVKVLQQQKAYQKVAAPFDGVITQRNIDIGSLVTADATSGTSMFAMTQSDVMRIQLFVPQDAAFGVSPGVDAVVRVPEIPGRTFPGTVTRIADALQPGTRTLLTEIDVPNPDGVLTPGIYCTVELQIPRKTPSLIVPAGAIIFNRHGLQVAVVENGVAHIRKVEVARDLGTEVEVRDGVKDGDEVVLYPPVELQDGGRVEIRHPPPGSNP
jgi:RND family efflux transporter MFP subunit